MRGVICVFLLNGNSKYYISDLPFQDIKCEYTAQNGYLPIKKPLGFTYTRKWNVTKDCIYTYDSEVCISHTQFYYNLRLGPAIK